MTVFFPTVLPVPQIMIDIIDEMGMSPDRLITGGETDIYQVRVGDTVTFSCSNAQEQGNSIIDLTTAGVPRPTGTDSITFTDIEAETFAEGVYACTINTQLHVDVMCGPVTDSVSLRLVGALGHECCSNYFDMVIIIFGEFIEVFIARNPVFPSEYVFTVGMYAFLLRISTV